MIAILSFSGDLSCLAQRRSGPLFFSQQGFAPCTKPCCVFPHLLLLPHQQLIVLVGAAAEGPTLGADWNHWGLRPIFFFPHDPRGSPKADYRSERWLLIPEGCQRWHAILSAAPAAQLLSRVLSPVRQEKTHSLSTRNSSMTPTRKPEELSSRQRKRQMKPLSRKEEFSSGSCSGSKVTRSEGVKEALLSAGGNNK